MIVHNANIYAVDSGFHVVNAMAIAEGKIVATGTDKFIMANYEADSTIDAQKKFTAN